ncbi:MAG: ATPase [Paracoccaceae bacterium]
MIYPTAEAWQRATDKHILLFGMSGLGKTYVSQMLRDAGSWFHYSIDYRIGTRYMGEYIIDNAKAEAMKVPFLRDLLKSDSIYIGSNISFENLAPVSAYLGKPGDKTKGGLPLDEYQRRQQQFSSAEIAALTDTGYFIDRAKRLYGYPNFICDTGGSICEWVDAKDLTDPLLKTLAARTLLIWIQGSEAHTEELIRRFDRAPKPMAYQPAFLLQCWTDYLRETGQSADRVEPDTFIRWTYAKALAHRQPRYEAMAKWGVTVTADEISALKSEADFDILIASAIDRQGALA